MAFLRRVSFRDEAQAIADAGAALAVAKVVVLEQLPDAADLMRFYGHLAEQLGEVVNAGEDNIRREATPERWVDITYDPAVPNRYRTAKVAQPLHTDGSYTPMREDEISFFYCERPASAGGATTFIDSREVVELLRLDGQDQLLEQLQTVEVRFERGASYRELPILRRRGEDYFFNYNYYCLAATASPAVRDLVERFQAFLEDWVMRAGIVTPVMLGRGDAVMFHDDRVLHGRNAFFARAHGDRCLMKGGFVLRTQPGSVIR